MIVIKVGFFTNPGPLSRDRIVSKGDQRDLQTADPGSIVGSKELRFITPRPGSTDRACRSHRDAEPGHGPRHSDREGYRVIGKWNCAKNFSPMNAVTAEILGPCTLRTSMQKAAYLPVGSSQR